MIGLLQLDERMADDDAYDVRGAGHDERCERQRERVRHANTIVAAPKTAAAPNILRPASPPSG